MKFRVKLLILVIALLPVFANAQESAKRKTKKIEKQKAKKERETLVNYKKAVKRHNKIQDKDTRKRMKSSRKQSGNLAKGKKTFFLKEWFAPKRKKTSAS